MLGGHTLQARLGGGEPAVVPLPLAQLWRAPLSPWCCPLRRKATADRPEPPRRVDGGAARIAGLPTRASLELAQRAAWACALQAPAG